MNLNCRPWWVRSVLPHQAPRRFVTAGGRAVDGRVPTSPEALRVAAEAKLAEMGLPMPVSLAMYTLARNTSSEMGNGSAEEKATVAMAAVNRAKLWKIDVNKLLLYHGARAGTYGPIHGEGATPEDRVKTAPYGRWASTSQDPAVDDVLIASLALQGKLDDFVGDDQYGPRYNLTGAIARVPFQAAEGNYWVGPQPHVNMRETMAFKYMPWVKVETPAGQALVKAAQDALRVGSFPQPLTICDMPITGAQIAGIAGAGAALAGVLALIKKIFGGR